MKATTHAKTNFAIIAFMFGAIAVVGLIQAPRASTAPPKSTPTSSVILPGGVKLEMVILPPGTFLMGSATSVGFDGGGHLVIGSGPNVDEDQHKVTLTKEFQIGKYPVTQRQWQAVMGNNPSHFSSCGLDCPVEQVSWDDCQQFVEKLNAQGLGGGFRLPTEAEWEYAARAGTEGATYGNLDEIGWWVGNAGASTHPVGQKKPNAFGLYDMIGNVEEWVQDGYGNYSSGSVTDPINNDNRSHRVIRGCSSYYPPAENCRSAFRMVSSPTERSQYLGFRLARQVQ